MQRRSRSKDPTTDRPTPLDLPTSVNVLGTPYSITYVDTPSEVDVHKRDAHFGQVDFWTRTIRIYKGSRPPEDLWRTILHEVIHAIVEALKIKHLNEDDGAVDLLAIGLRDVLFRNEWMR